MKTFSDLLLGGIVKQAMREIRAAADQVTPQQYYEYLVSQGTPPGQAQMYVQDKLDSAQHQVREVPDQWAEPDSTNPMTPGTGKVMYYDPGSPGVQHMQSQYGDEWINMLAQERGLHPSQLQPRQSFKSQVRGAVRKGGDALDALKYYSGRVGDTLSEYTPGIMGRTQQGGFTQAPGLGYASPVDPAEMTFKNTALQAVQRPITAALSPMLPRS